MAVSQVAYSGKKEVMVKIVKGGHLFVHSHYTFSLNQENFAESKALIELLRGLGENHFSPIPELAPVTTHVPGAIPSES